MYSQVMDADTILQILPQMDRIIFKLYRYGLASEDIAQVVDSDVVDINDKIFEIKKTLSEFADYV